MIVVIVAAVVVICWVSRVPMYTDVGLWYHLLSLSFLSYIILLHLIVCRPFSQIMISEVTVT